jgi:dipeptidyl aminopeptidase/acylaminoacyl peptidase
MKRALKKSSAPVTFMQFKDEDHYLSNQQNRQAFFQGLDEFLIKVFGEENVAQ